MLFHFEKFVFEEKYGEYRTFTSYQYKRRRYDFLNYRPRIIHAGDEMADVETAWYSRLYERRLNMYLIETSQLTLVTGGSDPKPCPKGGDCPIDTPQSELGKAIDDISRGLQKLGGEIVDVAKDIWHKIAD